MQATRHVRSRYKPRFALTMLGLSECQFLQTLARPIEDTFGADVSLTEAISLPRDAYNAARGQYHSTVLLEALAQHTRSDWDRLLGIADVDLYTPDLNFVFGEADSRRGVAILSVARLHTSNRERFVRRAATEAIHELAHTYRLGHCQNPACVMWFSNTLEETDRKGTRFCHAHARALRQAIGSKSLT